MPDRIPWTFGACGDVAERMDWLTDVLASITGAEQHRRLRIAPRIVQQFETLESQGARRQMEHLLLVNGGGLWDLPLVQDGGTLESAALEGASTLAVDTWLRRFKVGGRILVIRNDPRVFEVHTVAALTEELVTVVGELAGDWPAGTRVLPLVEGRFDQAPLLPRFTGEDALVQLQFLLTEPVDWPAADDLPLYRTFPVLELRVDWATDPQLSPDRGMATVDNDTGLPTYYDQVGIPLTLFRFQYGLVGREEIADFRALLYLLAGRWGCVWVPSQAADLKVVADLVAGNSYVDVEWLGISGWPIKVGHRDVRIELVDGTVLYRRISSATQITGNSERLVLDAPLGVNATTAQVLLVSFMSLARQDSDTNLVKYWTDGLVQSELTLRAIFDDV